MGSRYIRCYEELVLGDVRINDVGLQIDLHPLSSAERNPKIRVIVFSVEKDDTFEENFKELNRLFENKIPIVTIHDDVCADKSVISFFYEEGKLRKRIFFSTKELDGLEFLYCS